MSDSEPTELAGTAPPCSAANDGIVSTASLIVGVASAQAARSEILVAGIAGLVAGAMSMATGEFVPERSQADTEGADLARERDERAPNSEREHQELAAIYASRGLEEGLANEVARQLMARDALGAHARDQLGISHTVGARPAQAALASAATFTVGAALPLAFGPFVPGSALVWIVAGSALGFLALRGALSARAGGAPIATSVARVAFWGALAMAVTAGVGAAFGQVR